MNEAGYLEFSIVYNNGENEDRCVGSESELSRHMKVRAVRVEVEAECCHCLLRT